MNRQSGAGIHNRSTMVMFGPLFDTTFYRLFDPSRRRSYQTGFGSWAAGPDFIEIPGESFTFTGREILNLVGQGVSSDSAAHVVRFQLVDCNLHLPISMEGDFPLTSSPVACIEMDTVVPHGNARYAKWMVQSSATASRPGGVTGGPFLMTVRDLWLRQFRITLNLPLTSLSPIVTPYSFFLYIDNAEPGGGPMLTQFPRASGAFAIFSPAAGPLQSVIWVGLGSALDRLFQRMLLTTRSGTSSTFAVTLVVFLNGFTSPLDRIWTFDFAIPVILGDTIVPGTTPGFGIRRYAPANVFCSSNVPLPDDPDSRDRFWLAMFTIWSAANFYVPGVGARASAFVELLTDSNGAGSGVDRSHNIPLQSDIGSQFRPIFMWMPYIESPGATATATFAVDIL